MNLNDLQPGYELDALVAEAIGFPHMKAGTAYGRYLDAGQVGIITPGGKPQRFTGIGQIPVDFQPSTSWDDAMFAVKAAGMLGECNDYRRFTVRFEVHELTDCTVTGWTAGFEDWELGEGHGDAADRSFVNNDDKHAATHAISLAVCKFKGVGE